MTQVFYTYLPSPVGPFYVAGSEDTIVATGFEDGDQVRLPRDGWREDAAPLTFALEPLRAYFDGEVVEFNVPVETTGTDFQRSVWRALQDIPFGVTASYGDIARAIGNPKAVRAVGSANNANPIPIIIPCHRVIGADGTLVGFGGGLPAKAALLALEGAMPVNGELF
ncbi:MAG: methylated-DNA--[protein]-cysteine S-methyltransferase [Pseudomonadota bacterium]